MIDSYIAIGILIISIFFTAKLWMWIYKNAFGIQLNKKIIFISLFVGGIAAGSILMFPQIAKYFNLFSFLDQEYGYKVLLTFILYLNSLILILGAITKTLGKMQMINLVVFNIIFIVMFFILKQLNLEIYIMNIVLYYIFISYGEEFIKSQLGFIVNNNAGELDSDLLLYHILVAIGFAFWENILYLTGAIGFNSFITVLSGGMGIVLLRGILGFGAHTFYSSIIGMGNLMGGIAIFLGIIIAIIIHSLYNLSLYFEYYFIIPIFIIIVYLWISYIFYKIDRIYVN